MPGKEFIMAKKNIKVAGESFQNMNELLGSNMLKHIHRAHSRSILTKSADVPAAVRQLVKAELREIAQEVSPICGLPNAHRKCICSCITGQKTEYPSIKAIAREVAYKYNVNILSKGLIDKYADKFPESSLGEVIDYIVENNLAPEIKNGQAGLKKASKTEKLNKLSRKIMSINSKDRVAVLRREILELQEMVENL